MELFIVNALDSMSGGVGSAEQSTYNLYGYSENEIPGLWELLNKYYQLHLPE